MQPRTPLWIHARVAIVENFSGEAYRGAVLDIIRLGFSHGSGIDGAHEEFGIEPGPVDYMQAWEIQRRIHAEVVARQRPNTLLLLEHKEVFTAGKRTQPHERPRDGAPVIDVDRGGKITWHGPQQLVGYPIVKLPAPIDVVGFVRGIEQAIMGVCTRLGVGTTTIEGRSGVWTQSPAGGEKKVCAIGLRVSKRCTMHGFAFNLANDLSWSHNIIPCGIEDAGVSSISQELGRTVRPVDVIDEVEQAMRELVRERGET